LVTRCAAPNQQPIARLILLVSVIVADNIATAA
jgi:hypothetical protein